MNLTAVHPVPFLSICLLHIHLKFCDKLCTIVPVKHYLPLKLFFCDIPDQFLAKAVYFINVNSLWNVDAVIFDCDNEGEFIEIIDLIFPLKSYTGTLYNFAQNSTSLPSFNLTRQTCPVLFLKTILRCE